MNIDKLLKKKGWTGAELGRLELANTFTAFAQALQGVKDPKPLISNADFNKMISTITEPAEGRTYNNYLKIHEWIAKTYNMAVAQEQQANLNFNKLLNTLSNAMVAEELYSYIAELPAIMTAKQYKDIVDSRTKEILHPDGEEIGFNVFNMLEQALLYYVHLLQKEPRKKNPLKPLKKKLEQELVTEPRILTRYNEVMGNGYYEREDGTRSDKVPSEEWSKLTPVTEDPEEQMELRVERATFINEAIMKEGLTEEEAQGKLAQVKELAYYKDLQPATWHIYEAPPEDLNKWEIIEAGDLFEYFPALAGEGTDEEQLADMEAFKKEFPEIVTTLLKDMERYIKGISSLPIEKWLDSVYMWEDLYKVDFYGFKTSFVESDTTIFDGNRRAIFNGIAILRPSDLLSKSPRIDEKGYYKAPDPKGAIATLSLDRFFTDNEDYATNTDRIAEERQTLIESLYYVYGFNKAIELIAEYYKVEELLVTQIPYEGFMQRIRAFNGLIASLYKKIKSIDYEDKELQEKKFEVLKDVLYPIEEDFLQIPEERIAQVKRALKDFKAFDDGNLDPCAILCFLPEGV
ncbi:MAG: hypothetical protein WC097_01530 [Eubacteriales bacterium]